MSNEMDMAGDTYVAGVRDLAAMPHVGPELGDVFRDCADRFEALQAEHNALNAEVERWHDAYEIAFNQAMKNGARSASLQSQLTAAKEALEVARKTIAECGSVFAYYADEHNLKASQTIDPSEHAARRKKAARNEEMAQMCLATLSTINGGGK